ncbi:hypothetical protein MTsPCn7_26490 [Altererythrobacter sp. MTPC7]
MTNEAMSGGLDQGWRYFRRGCRADVTLCQPIFDRCGFMDKPDRQMGRPAGAPVGLANQTPFSGPPDLTYLCDAGCRPNPGKHLPVVWDGACFLPMMPIEGTNHQACYQAILQALRDAGRRGALRVELRLTSDLVFRQLSTGRYCRNRKLEDLRDLCLVLASRTGDVRLVRVTEPFGLGARHFQTRHDLRDHVLGLGKPAASNPASHRSPVSVSPAEPARTPPGP